MVNYILCRMVFIELKMILNINIYCLKIREFEKILREQQKSLRDSNKLLTLDSDLQHLFLG